MQAAVDRPGATRDGELLERVKARDVLAFERLYRVYQPRLARFVTNIVNRPELVEEVLDDTMMAVWNTAGNFRGASKVSTWIFGIAYRVALKARRRWDMPVEFSPDVEQVSDEIGPDDKLHQSRRQDALRNAINQLSVDHRAVLELTYFQGMGYREIAAIVGCPVDTVKTRMFHARRKLKAMLTGGTAEWL